MVQKADTKTQALIAKALDKPAFTSKNGETKFFRMKSLEQFKAVTGVVPGRYEFYEVSGLDLHAVVMTKFFSEPYKGAEELYVGSWKDHIVEVSNRLHKGSKEYFGIRVGEQDCSYTVPAMDEVITLTPREAALVRMSFAASGHGDANMYELVRKAVHDVESSNIYKATD